jgi:hypothetical protein
VPEEEEEEEVEPLELPPDDAIAASSCDPGAVLGPAASSLEAPSVEADGNGRSFPPHAAAAKSTANPARAPVLRPIALAS